MKKTIALLITIASFGLLSQAQNGVSSPYSRYGYGQLSDNATSTQKAMGGVGYAMNSGRQINVMNPASYAAIDSLTFLFDMGANIDFLTMKEGDVSESSTNGGLDYITMAFPISRRIGASIGLLPYSSTGYSFSSEITNGASTYEGSGGINQLYIGAGVNPLANLYIGFNLGYLFGNTTNNVYAATVTGSTSLFGNYLSVTDWHLDLGAQYPLNINPDNRLTLGVSYSPGKSLHGETYATYYDATLDTYPDTLGYMKLKGNFSIPATYGAGINYMWRDRLMVEADFLYQPWKDAKFKSIDNIVENTLANRWKVALGAQFTPSPRGSFVQRIQYRAGGYYNNDYVMVRGNQVREYGLSLGFGLPVPGFKSIVNLGLQYKHRQAHPDPLVKEEYFNISLGINFNEMWFRKSRIY